MPTEKEYQQLVFNTAVECGLSELHAKIITAQATYESGHFASNVFKTDNNLFGMKMPARRSKRYISRASKITMISEGSTPYAHFDSIQNSVKDLILGYHCYNSTNWSQINSPVQYATYLKSKGYFGGSLSNYATFLDQTVKKFTWLKFTGLALIAQLIIGAVVVLALKFYN